MKKVLAIIAAMSLVLSMAACGNKKSNLPSQGGAAVDENGNEIIGTTIDGAGDEVDMDKVKGDDLKMDKDADSVADGTIAGLDVKIDEAKLMDNDGEKLLVLSIKYKNKTDEPVMFESKIQVELTQGGKEVRTTLTNNVKGINVRSGIEAIEPGDSTTVQKTYPITDTETPVKVVAYECNNPSGASIGATFNLI